MCADYGAGDKFDYVHPNFLLADTHICPRLVRFAPSIGAALTVSPHSFSAHGCSLAGATAFLIPTTHARLVILARFVVIAPHGGRQLVALEAAARCSMQYPVEC